MQEPYNGSIYPQLNRQMMMEVARGSVIRIKGPARVSVIRGKIMIVGAEYGDGSSIIIHSLRSYGIKVLEDTVLEVSLGNEASIELVDPREEVVDRWLEISEGILNDLGEHGALRIVVVGPVESGKTTLSAFIANRALARGASPALIEGDVGQEDIGVPGTVSLAYLREPVVWQRQLRADRIRFVGCLSPHGCISRIVSAIASLVKEAEQRSNVVIVNTDGWVNEHRAISYKLELIRLTRPTHVVVLDPVIANVFRSSLPPSINVLTAPPPKVAATRDRSDRRYLRTMAYKKYFSNNRVVTFRLDEVRIIGSCILAGRELNPEAVADEIGVDSSDVVYASEYLGTRYVILRRSARAMDLPRKYIAVREGEWEGLLLGVVDEDLGDVGIAILKKLDFRERKLSVVIPREQRPSPYFIAGRIKVNEKFEDYGRVTKCVI